MNETVEKTRTGAILYDPTILNQMSDEVFAPEHWRHSAAVPGHLRSAGRGATCLVSDGQHAFVLRHFHRGGLVSRVTSDAYLWLGEDRTRSFREFRLLAALTAKGLPVPRPAAARYRRRGLLYTADLMTEYVPDIRPLSARVLDAADADFWHRLGSGIARFHDAGVNHADLNAYNVQVDANDDLFMLDFDRGRLTTQGPWRERNLSRLRRSLEKIRRLDNRARFSTEDWRALEQGYFGLRRSA